MINLAEVLLLRLINDIERGNVFLTLHQRIKESGTSDRGVTVEIPYRDRKEGKGRKRKGLAEQKAELL